VLDRRARARVAVTDPGSFQAVTLPSGWACDDLRAAVASDEPRSR
jgi:hypothetical protein